MQVFKFCGIFCTILWSLVASQNTAFAQVIISEVYPAPGVGESEWIEVYNAGDDSINLDGWVLFDQLATPSLLHTFPLGSTLSPLSYLLIELSGTKLNNAGDGVELRDSTGEVVDEFVYTSSQSGQSWQRQYLGSTSLVLTDPTPGAAHADWPLDGSAPPPTPSPSPQPSSTPPPQPTPTMTPNPTPTPQTNINPDHIKLVEINACPAEGKESITLLNTGADAYLDGWQVIDAAGNYKLISGHLPAGGGVLYEWSGSLLNNTGDSLSLVTNTGFEVASAEYDQCDKGLPLVLAGDTWLPKNYATTAAIEAAETNATTSTSINESSEAQGSILDTATLNDPTTGALVGSGAAQLASATAKPLGTLSTKLQLTPEPIPLPTNAIDPAISVPISPTNYPTWPAWSVIMGGLLQLLPSIYLLYDKLKLTSASSPIFG